GQVLGQIRLGLFGHRRPRAIESSEIVQIPQKPVATALSNTRRRVHRAIVPAALNGRRKVRPRSCDVASKRVGHGESRMKIAKSLPIPCEPLAGFKRLAVGKLRVVVCTLLPVPIPDLLQRIDLFHSILYEQASAPRGIPPFVPL